MPWIKDSNSSSSRYVMPISAMEIEKVRSFHSQTENYLLILTPAYGFCLKNKLFYMPRNSFVK